MDTSINPLPPPEEIKPDDAPSEPGMYQPKVMHKPSHTKKGLFALVILLLLFAAGFAGYETRTVDAPSPGQTSGNGNNASSITIKNVAIHEQNHDPALSLITNSGHYLADSSANNELLYDGKRVYSGKDLCGSGTCAVLSKNGLHYAYYINDSKNRSKIYIDGKYITTLGVNSQLVAVSNDGKSYMYTDLSSDLKSETLYRDGKMLYKSLNLIDIQTSADLSDYMMAACTLELTQTGCDQYAVVLNGKAVYTSSKYNNTATATSLNQDWLTALSLSENGKHYAYFTPPDNSDKDVSYNPSDGGALNIDGKFVSTKNNGGPYVTQTTGSVSSVIATDGGAAAFTDESSVYVYTPSEVAGSGQAKFYPEAGNTKVFLNGDASQVLLSYAAGNTNINVSNDNAWVLNGKTLQVPQYTQAADFDGNTLYLYNYN